MRLLLALLLLVTFVSCGKKSSSGSGSDDKKPRQEQQNPPSESPVEDLAPGSHSDLLNVTLDVQAQISDKDIVFKSSKSMSDKGEISECKESVSLGEVYQYTLSGDELKLQTPTTSYTMKRVGTFGNGVYGSWYSTTKSDTTRRATRLSVLPNRVILNVDCEFNG